MIEFKKPIFYRLIRSFNSHLTHIQYNNYLIFEIMRFTALNSNLISVQNLLPLYSLNMKFYLNEKEE